MDKKNQIEIYQTEDGEAAVQVLMENETVWLTQRQMADVFDTSLENVLMHLKNIYKDKELNEVSTAKDFLVVRQEGRRQVRRKIRFY